MDRIAAVVVAASLLSGCASPVDKQLEAVKAARSVMAEWALVEQRAAQGEAPATYTAQMRDAAKRQLRTAQASLITGQPRAAALIGGLADGEPSADALQAAQDALEPLENTLEHS